MQKSELGQSSMVSEKNKHHMNSKTELLNMVDHLLVDYEDEHSIELASLQSSKKSKKKKKKKSKKSKKAVDETEESVSSSPFARLKKKKKKKKSKKTNKDGKSKSKKIKKESQSSCSTSGFYSSVSSLASMDTFAFDDDDDGSQESQDSCYKSSTASLVLTPLGLSKKKLVVPSSAPVGKGGKRSTLTRPRSPSAALGAWMLSPKQSEPPISRRARTMRVTMAGGLNATFHGHTPTATQKMTVKLEKNLHDSMPDLFASPGRGAFDASPGQGRRRLKLEKNKAWTPPGRGLLDASPVQGRRRIKLERNKTSTPPGRGALDASPVQGRRRIKLEKNKAWTPRGPTLTRRISSKSLMDEISNSSMQSFFSGSGDSSEDPFKSPTQDKPAPVPLVIPDLFGDSSDDDDGILANDNPFASPPGPTSKKKARPPNNEINPFELVTTLMDARRQPSKAYDEHEQGAADVASTNHGGTGNLSLVSPTPNMTSKAIDVPEAPPVQENDASESSLAADGFFTPAGRTALRKIALANLCDDENMASKAIEVPETPPVQENDASESSLAADGFFSPAGRAALKKTGNLSLVSPTPNMASKAIDVPETPPVQENDASESSLAADGFFTPAGHAALKKIPLANLCDDNNVDDDERSLDVDDLFGLALKPSPSGEIKENSAKVDDSLSDSDFAFDSPSFSGRRGEEKSKKKLSSKKSSGKVIAPTSSRFGDEMNRSFHDALAANPFDSSSELLKNPFDSSSEFKDPFDSSSEFKNSFDSSSEQLKVGPMSPLASKKKNFSGKVIAPTGSINDQMNRSFHDALGLDPFESSQELNTKDLDTETDGFGGRGMPPSSDLIEKMNQSFHDALKLDPFESLEFKPISFDAESPTVGDTKRDGVVENDNDSSSNCSFGACDQAENEDSWEHFPKNSLSGFIKKNRNNPSYGNESIGEISKSSRSSRSSKSLDRLKLPSGRSKAQDRLKLPNRQSSIALDRLKLPSGRSKSQDRLKVPNRRSRSLDKLKLPSGRSKSQDRLKLPNRQSSIALDKFKLPSDRSKSKDRLKLHNRQSSIDDLIGLQKSTSSKSWNRLRFRSAMSVVSMGSRGSEATKTTDPESTSSNASWSNPSTGPMDPIGGGRLRTQIPSRRIRNSELSQSEHGVFGTETRIKSGLGSSRKVSRSSSSKLSKRKKKKKNILSQSEHSTRATDSSSLPGGKELELPFRKKRGGSKSKSKSRVSVSAIAQSGQESQD
eukprot:CAMPEP_0113660086 /NCGR_PEP_ID=MMETSP0017_2-20120614/32705_1 /TAXON_ID=2856 /ORGANISM="Cylindrotheca closterium" /LENGTH=1233 /DNA_ID=CAMNT_0000574683 /DNA_START=57 /DNA_END=3755 /DNA_ORIENTATION=- /assembly_acc=CAM_ASM_000147